MNSTDGFRLLVRTLCLSCFAGSSLILFASDPLDQWTWRNPLPTGNILEGVASNGSLRVVVGQAGTILTSPNGEIWTHRSAGTGASLYSIEWTGTRFVAIGDRIVLLSSDGIHWEAHPNMVGKMKDIIWTGGQFVAVGKNQILTSSDGIEWTVRHSDSFIGQKFHNFQSIAWNGTRYVAAGWAHSGFGNDGIGTIWTSPDAIKWTLEYFPEPLYGIASDGDGFVAVGQAGTVQVSRDGTDWMDVSTGITGGLYSVAWNGHQFVAAGDRGAILTSSDGSDWTLQSMNTFAPLYAVSWDGEQHLAVGMHGTILTSPDGVNWIRQSSSAISGSFKSVTWNGSHILAVGSDGVAAMSPDGIQWTSHSTGTSGSLNGVTWGNGQFVAVGRGRIIVTSPDGKTWTRRVENLGSPSLNDVVWNGRLFLAVGERGVTMRSPDGINWTQTYSAPAQPNLWDTLNAVVWNGNLFVAVGARGRIATSPNGIQWTIRDSGLTHALNAIAWNDDLFVVVGSSSTVLTSRNGIDWTQHNSPSSFSGRGLAWSGRHFVAGGWQSRRIITSPDGVNWTSRFTGASDLWDITWTGKNFVAVGERSGIIQSGDFASEPLVLRQAAFQEGLFRFQFSTTPGETYLVQASANATDWTTLTELIADANKAEADFVDNAAEDLDHRFYRVLASSDQHGKVRLARRGSVKFFFRNCAVARSPPRLFWA